jgi:acetylornithine deacetylase
LEIATDADAVQRVAALCGTSDLTKVSFGTEAGFFAGLGIPTVVCGPGSMEGQGHKADEYISMDQLARCDAMMAQIHAHLR